MKKVWKSDDGRIFENREECERYEKKNDPEVIVARKKEVMNLYDSFARAFNAFIDDYPEEELELIIPNDSNMEELLNKIKKFDLIKLVMEEFDNL